MNFKPVTSSVKKAYYKDGKINVELGKRWIERKRGKRGKQGS